MNKTLHDVGKELGRISGDAVAHAHEQIQRKLLKDPQLSKRVERIYQTISQ
jgi:chromosomal replication initiation ATPase DnaA